MPLSDVPTRETLVRWLRLNLGLTVFVISVVSGAGGALVSGTRDVARFDRRLSDLENASIEAISTHKVEQARVEALTSDLREARTVDLNRIDNRITTLESHLLANTARLDGFDLRSLETNDQRVKLASDLGLVDQRLSVIEAQIKFIGDFTRENLIAIARKR